MSVKGQRDGFLWRVSQVPAVLRSLDKGLNLCRPGDVVPNEDLRKHLVGWSLEFYLDAEWVRESAFRRLSYCSETNALSYSFVSLFYSEPPFYLPPPVGLPICYPQDENLDSYLNQVRRHGQTRPMLQDAIMRLAKAYYRESYQEMRIRKLNSQKRDIRQAIDWAVRAQVEGQKIRDIAITERNSNDRDVLARLIPTIDKSIYRTLRQLAIPRRSS